MTQSLQERSAAIEQQLQQIQSCTDPATRAAALELLRSVMELHKDGLARLLDMVGDAAPAPNTLIERLADDPLVSGLLTLHDLHPDSAEKRVTRALQRIQPELERAKAEVKLLSISEDEVRVALRIQQQCGSTAMLAEAVEQALIHAAPDARIVVEDESRIQATFVPIAALQPTGAEGAPAAAMASGIAGAKE